MTKLSEQRLKKEHDTLRQHLSNLMLPYIDLCRKYKNSKRLIDVLRARSTILPLNEYANRNETKYEPGILTEKHMEISNQEVQLMQDRYEFEVHKLHTVMKRFEHKENYSYLPLDRRTNECLRLFTET
ncbi:hypothetical protein ILUMI_01788 [Ignelater luminosus]|uniref:Uncharacterized protein n=1 Tax=Ignelater luminosus TaxID=2038154 RepID=A0A8K0DJC8_IGNLU|nr:hypothetical protein ILUMI_01788 [Ignelater luminosus]